MVIDNMRYFLVFVIAEFSSVASLCIEKISIVNVIDRFDGTFKLLL